ncbi:ABC transporter permease [Actinomadura algeriensis]|uniref:Peptide/nickel transport system permease protein n=1 Tax=Actinomadura algeriensis TaxID=1679523 RepID=A0ABR9K033_9ACTN|nr:ABC transporter permease [Actinomadura algeriensis]MBE1536201.1 peptide/nickel transport system permease protein [Actinomadura algeriensis]
MAGFALRRLLFAALVMWLVSTLVFAFLHLSPVAVERVVAGPRATPDTLERVRAGFGLDRPVPVQYAMFIGRLVGGDLGDSYVSGAPVAGLIADRLPTTLLLVFGAAVLWFAGGVAAGAVGAARARGPWDRAMSVFTLVGLSTPPFVAALVLLHVLSTRLGDAGLPFFEAGPPLQEHFLRRMILPWTALALLMAAAYTRLTRGALLDALGEDYVRTARAKGLTERRVVVRHGLRSALTPVVTQFGVDVGALIGSTVVTEKVFGLQGVGQLVTRSIATGDTPVVIGVTLTVTLFVIVANLLVDFAYSLLDPRVRPG